jgi:hypothetical protein
MKTRNGTTSEEIASTMILKNPDIMVIIRVQDTMMIIDAPDAMTIGVPDVTSTGTRNVMVSKNIEMMIAQILEIERTGGTDLRKNR